MVRNATIRPMTHADLPAARALFESEGWTDRSPFFAFGIEHDECRPIVVDVDGAVAATGMGTASGEVGWIAVIFVARERRGEGLGRLVSEAVCDDLEARGCRTILLMASDAGRPVYERLGFRIATWAHLFEPPHLSAAGSSATWPSPANGRGGGMVRSLLPDDSAAVISLDRAATGEDRAHLVRSVLPVDGGSGIGGTEGGLRAFQLDPSWGGHPLVAPDPLDALALLERASGQTGGHRRRASVYAENEAGRALLAARGWREMRRMPRMARGAPLAWRPDWIWGNFTFGLG